MAHYGYEQLVGCKQTAAATLLSYHLNGLCLLCLYYSLTSCARTFSSTKFIGLWLQREQPATGVRCYNRTCIHSGIDRTKIIPRFLHVVSH
jgi:hypothetical protein